MLHEEYEPGRRLPYHLRKKRSRVTGEVTIRPATEADMPAVASIYAHYVLNTAISFDDEPWPVEKWVQKYRACSKLELPFLVAVSEHGQVLGFAYVSPWSHRGAYKQTVENSIYLRPAATGLRLGPKLMNELIERCREAGVRQMVAVIADKGAEASIRMHEKLGFKEVGRLGKVGFKFGKSYGTVLMQKSMRQGWLSRRRAAKETR